MHLFAHLNLTTIVFLLLIIGITIYSLLEVRWSKIKVKLTTRRRRIELYPSLVSTLGVLGTFWGITAGLLNFNTSDLNASIPLLLEGLKTAFFTSLAGMICSLFLSHYISRTLDNKDGGISDVNMAASEIVNAVKAMSEANNKTFSELMRQATKQTENQTSFYTQMGYVMQRIENAVEATKTGTNDILLQAQTQSSLFKDLDLGLSKTNDNVAELINIISSVLSTENEVSVEVKKFGDRLHAEVIEIEDKMQNTNLLLSQKFDEFTELLKKSNTEALVEVMNQVTEEFQKSMNELIGKLVQENFDQLNTSVERLNAWQQENKEMILLLTAQYKEMADNFKATSITLSRVGSDTQTLVSDGGKLRQLINTLNKVMIEDERFVQITGNLTQTVSLTQKNMTQFENATRSLNDWVRKQRNFVDGVQLLIEKLDELNKLRDYNANFWKETKHSLEEGVGIVAQGSKILNQELTDLDKKFYARLSATLAELDTCIQAMIIGKQ